MDNYERQLLESAIDLLHRLLGRADAKDDFKPILRFVPDEPLPFAGRKPPLAESQEENFYPNEKKPDAGTSGEEGFVEFTEKEIRQMPEHFRKMILVNRKRCRMRRHKSGKNGWTYEIRYRAEGYNLSAGGKTIELAKANMLQKMKKAKRPIRSENDVPDTFHSFATYYFEHFRKGNVAQRTYSTDLNRYEKYLKPHFDETPLDRITPTDCKNLIDQIEADGKGKTADEVYSLMSVIFKGAISHHLITFSPLSIVQHRQHERKSGTALTREEEKLLLEGLTERPFQIAAALALFCGLRPNELETARIEGAFIVAKNSKRKNKVIEYKKIPIIERLRPYIKDGIPPLPSSKLLQRRVKAVLPNHIPYDLRRTFYTRCDEYGVEEPARDEFVGHSKGRLTAAYRDLPDSYLLKEGKKLDEWV